MRTKILPETVLLFSLVIIIPTFIKLRKYKKHFRLSFPELQFHRINHFIVFPAAKKYIITCNWGILVGGAVTAPCAKKY